MQSPTRTGFAFLGWYTEPGGGGTQFTTSTSVVTVNITVYAKWQERDKLTVIFDADGGTINGDPTYTITDILYDSTVTLPAVATVVKAPYHFGGWYTATNGGGSQFTASTRVTADITVYAKWQYEVTFDANGGSFSNGSTTQTRLVNIGGSVGANNMPSATKTEKRFFGWYTDPAAYDDTTAFYESTPVNGDITVYARWIDAGVLWPYYPTGYGTGIMRFTILWYQNNDLNARCEVPPNENIIDEDNRIDYGTGGYMTHTRTTVLDNIAYGLENIMWPGPSPYNGPLQTGDYTFSIYVKTVKTEEGRPSHDTRPGFWAEIEFAGELHRFYYAQPLLTINAVVDVATVHYDAETGKFDLELSDVFEPPDPPDPLASHEVFYR
jgi:uncharacterized repeat protein (TIGR02543 family)